MTLIWIKNKYISKISHNSLINEKSYKKPNSRIKWEFGLKRRMISTWQHLLAGHRWISMNRDSAFSPFKFPLLSIPITFRTLWSTVFWGLPYSAFYPPMLEVQRNSDHVRSRPCDMVATLSHSSHTYMTALHCCRVFPSVVGISNHVETFLDYVSKNAECAFSLGVP